MNTLHRVVVATTFVTLFLAPIARAAGSPPRLHGVHFIYLIRHGAYDRDTVQADDRIGGALNALGHDQGKLIGERLASLPVRFHALATSDFTRARETANDIGVILHMTPMQDSLIHECTPTADRDDYMKNHSPANIAVCDANLQAAWAKYFKPTPDGDTHDLLVSHGNAIRWMVAKALGMDIRAWSHFDIANASLTVINIRADGSMRLAMFSDVGHLPVNKQAWSGMGGGWQPPPGVGAGAMK